MPPAWHRAPEITPPARLPGCTGNRIGGGVQDFLR
jgi:hypothetical protein